MERESGEVRRAQPNRGGGATAPTYRVGCLVLWHSSLDSKLVGRAGRGEPRPRLAFELDRRPPVPSARLVLVVLVRFVDGDAAEILRHFQQALVAVVPFGADFAKKHRSLVGPAQLQKSNLTHVAAQPASIFHIVAVA